MPLFKSKKAQMPAPQPKSDNLALAYSVARNAKKKKMAQGGEVSESPMDAQKRRMEDEMDAKMQANQEEDDQMDPIEASERHKFAKGGMPSHPKSISAAIMEKRKAYADGGMVDIEENGQEDANPFDEMNEDAIKKELYDDSQMSAQPEDSNEHGDDIEADMHDMISQIRSKIKAKRGM